MCTAALNRNNIIILILFICACDNEFNSNPPISIEDLLNQTTMELKLTTNEFIQINQSEKLVKWKVSVGRKNFKNTEFNFFNNKEQRKVRFIKAGQYQLTLTSQALGNSPNIEQHVLDIIVED